jgi:hypothetical protein
MLSGTPTGQVVSTPTWTRTRTKTLGGSCAVRYTIGMKGRRLDSHQHEPLYKSGAFLSRATSAISGSSFRPIERKERGSNPQGRSSAGFQPGPVANRVALPFFVCSQQPDIGQ